MSGTVPQISIILPVYNGAQTIARALRSLTSQTFPHFEVIIVDDGSTDATAEALAEAARDPRFRIFHEQHSGNPALCRNRGLREAKGEFLCFLDADDWWAEDYLESKRNALEKHPHAQAVYSWVDVVDRNGKFLWPGLRLRHEMLNTELFLGNVLVTSSNIFFHRSVLQQVGFLDEQLPHLDDWDFCLRIAEQFCFAALPKVQVFYCCRPESDSFQTGMAEREVALLLEKALVRDATRKPLRAATEANSLLYFANKDLVAPQSRQPVVRACYRVVQLLSFRRIRFLKAKAVFSLAFRCLVGFCSPRLLRSLSRVAST